MLSDQEIEDALTALEERKAKLMKLKKLQNEVAILEVDAIAGGATVKASVLVIEEMVLKHFELSGADIRSKKKFEHIVMPRMIIFYLCRKLTSASLDFIGQMYGKDHGTVLHGYHRIRDSISVDPQFKLLVARLQVVCQERINETTSLHR